jgi:hypothetical protein
VYIRCFVKIYVEYGLGFVGYGLGLARREEGPDLGLDLAI